ncbi:transposase [Nibricoccus sp. IMCC34717]|uniref:IS110 family transposase n=1 Tax=Nibricoccus sp. IMCC34717 TaxID=3034021 RepID=UPI00384F22D6
MKTNTNIAYFNQTEKYQEITLDVSKNELWWLCEDDRTGELPYQNEAVEGWLKAELERARKEGFAGVRLTCEPTGHYHKRLLRLADAIGCETALVSGQHVNMAQVIVDNTEGKSDSKDRHTIMLLVQMGKAMKNRKLKEYWEVLRELGAEHGTLERILTATKNQIHAVLDELFPDLSFKRDWRFEGEACRVVLELYGMDPAQIVEAGLVSFRGKLERRDVRPKTIERLWNDAKKAQIDSKPAVWREMKVSRLRHLYRELELNQQRHNEVRQRMVDALAELQKCGEARVKAIEGVIGPVALARIYAETGPMSDFSSADKLLKYAGMNIRPRSSGKWKGKDKQSKKGRARLRYVTAQTILKLVVKGGLYGEYFHRKREEGMPGPVAMTAVARKFLKLLYALDRNGQAFDKKRAFACESQMKAA